jgi:hypothetical protein
MTIEQAKECLESIDILKYRDDDKNYFFDDVKGALDIAIKSLEMWDKVTDELEEYKITGSQMECFGTTEENAKEYIPIDTALEIINKHLKEIEE